MAPKLVLCLALAATACSRASNPDAGHAPAPSLIRLVDRLADAEISSPLHDIVAHRDARALPSTTVFREGFERFSRAAARWPAGAGCAPVARPDAAPDQRVLHYRGSNAHHCVFLIPAEPSTYYVVERSVRSEDPDVDVRVLESRVALANPTVFNHPSDIERAISGRFVRMKDLLFVHHFPRSTDAHAWQDDAIQVLSSPHTRSLVLQVHDAEGTLTSGGAQAWFDDVQVAKVNPTDAQLLSLLKGRLAAEGADPSLGLHKYGQFLPVGSIAGANPVDDDNHAYRDGILAVAPTDVRFALRVPPRARLSFAAGLFKASRSGDTATFRVVIEANGEVTTVFAREIAARPDDWHWHDAVVDLEAWAGQDIRLLLETRAPSKSRGLAVWGTPLVTSSRRAGDPPNVVVIAVDTLRADRLSAYGYGRRTSPHIESLAAGGTLFQHAFSASNWTSPAFASIFTGVMPSQHQVIHRARAIPGEMTTLAEYFRRAGWTTHAILYKAYLYNMGFEQGFDTWANVPRYDVRADDNLAKAMAWLDQHAHSRFFLFLHFNDPHQPFNQPPPFDRVYNSADDLTRYGVALPIVIEPSGGVRGCTRCTSGGAPKPGFKKLAHALYDGAVAYVDDRIGKFLGALKERALYDQTIIAFVSDHGEILWEYDGYFGHGGTYLRDELTRVPLVIKPHAESGLAPRRVDAQVRSFDLMPTLLDLAGLSFPRERLAAQSLVDFMRGEGPPADRAAFSENVKHHVLSLRESGFMYYLRHAPASPPAEQLFDLSADPAHSRNVAQEKTQVLYAMRRQAADFLLRERHGLFLVVLGDGRLHDYAVRLSSDATSTPVSLIGAPLQRRTRQREFRGRLAGSVVLLARLGGAATPAPTVAVAVDGQESVVQGPLAPVKHSPILLDDAVASGEARVYLVRTPRELQPATERQTTSGERLEALRALGYVQ